MTRPNPSSRMPPALPGRPSPPRSSFPPPPPPRPTPAPRRWIPSCALMIPRAYRVRGHLEAQLDPLGLKQPRHHPELDPATYGFTEADLDRPIFIGGVLALEIATVREILAILRAQLLRPHRRGIHAHPGSCPKSLDPEPHRARPLAEGLQPGRKSTPSCASSPRRIVSRPSASAAMSAPSASASKAARAPFPPCTPSSRPPPTMA